MSAIVHAHGSHLCAVGMVRIFPLSGREILIYLELRFCFSIHITDNIGPHYLIYFGSLSLIFLISKYVVPNYFHCSCTTQNLTFIHIVYCEILTSLNQFQGVSFAVQKDISMSSYRGHSIEFPILDFLSPFHMEYYSFSNMDFNATAK